MKTMIGLVLLVSSVAFAQQRPDQTHVYRLDFTVVESDGGKAPTSTSYTLNLEERHSGEIKVGSNVALSGPTPGATMRADVGLRLRASFTTVGDDLLVDDDIEVSATQGSQTFRKMAATGNALIAPGKPALVASVEDPIGHKRYQVTVRATRLR